MDYLSFIKNNEDYLESEKTYSIIIPEDVPSGKIIRIQDGDTTFGGTSTTGNWEKGTYVLFTTTSTREIVIDRVVPPYEQIAKMSDLNNAVSEIESYLQDIIDRIASLEGVDATLDEIIALQQSYIADNLQNVSNTLNEATNLANSYINGGAE